MSRADVKLTLVARRDEIERIAQDAIDLTEVGWLEEIWADGGQTKTLLFDNPEQGGWFRIALRALTDAVKAVEDGDALAYCVTWAPGYKAEYLRRVGVDETWVRS